MHIYQNKLLQEIFLPDVQARWPFTTDNHRKPLVQRPLETGAYWKTCSAVSVWHCPVQSGTELYRERNHIKPVNCDCCTGNKDPRCYKLRAKLLEGLFQCDRMPIVWRFFGSGE